MEVGFGGGGDDIGKGFQDLILLESQFRPNCLMIEFEECCLWCLKDEKEFYL